MARNIITSPKRQLMTVIALYTVVGMLIYSNVLVNGIFLFDDYEYVVGNPMLQAPSLVGLSDPRQVGYLSFALNYALGGDDPTGFHLFNVGVHIVNAILVLLLARTLLSLLSGHSSAQRDGSLHAISILSGLLFLVHPLQTQAVSYITQRFTSLATLFYLLSILTYLHARMDMERGAALRRGYTRYILSLLSALLAMKTKEIAFTLPFMVAALEIMLFQNSIYRERRYIYLIPHAAMLLVIPLSIFGPSLGLIGAGEGIAEITRKEKIYDFTQRSWSEYFLTQIRVLVTYLRLLLLPLHQQVVYDYKVIRSLLDVRLLPSLMILLATAAYGILQWKRARSIDNQGATESRLIAIGIGWFFLTMSVESSVVPIKDLIFEHRMYLPSVGFLTACAVVIVRSARLLVHGRRQGLTTGFIAAAIAAPLSLATYARNDIWTDEIKFWNDVVNKAPNKAIGYHNRGNAYAKIGDYDLALQDIDKTISFFPPMPSEDLGYEKADYTPINMSKTYMNRGSVYLGMGNLEAARADFDLAKRLLSAPPLDREKTLMLADGYSKRGAYKHAIEEYNKVLEWEPENLDVLNDRANAYSWTKNYRDAIRDLSKIILIRPDSALAYHNRGIAYAWSAQRSKAVADFEKACELGFEPACESIEKARRGEQ